MPVIDIVLAVVAGFVGLVAIIALVMGVCRSYRRELQKEKEEQNRNYTRHGARAVDPTHNWHG